ncbi:neuraminidase-like domain-containing protein [Pseudomonas sp. UBA1879]|uniref:Tc toxin subunit A-related protein n=1 Tax=Pseudomonas sp. UBA1879 TaxID=1947305 RepID=UPI0025F064EB|nr:neuraminidase-like domain-containing protein [Pseudomonas sp. UBA1879]
MDQSIIGVLEQQRRDALVAWYLGQLVPQAERQTRVLTENDLYEYLLIDNQVTAQVDTSRVAQGIASVQQHIHAIYNGMEPGYGSVGQDTLTLWRDGMSQYSQWAGYQMLEDYPENYLQPALRLDKTSMFKTFESELSQARLSEDTVQKALGNYLQAFETVSNLETVACYVNDTKFINADYYFLGRQRTEPFAFYWRKSHLYKSEGADKAQMAGWTEWKPVDAITGAQVKHCRPVVMDGRLYVVWAQSGKAVVDKEGKKTGTFEYVINLAYRRLDDSWSVPIELHRGQAPDELFANELDSMFHVTKGYRMMASVDHRDNDGARLLVNFEAKGFAESLNTVLVFDRFIKPLDNTEGLSGILNYMAGPDVRRVQYCADLIEPADIKSWKIASVVWDRANPPTTPGNGEQVINNYLELGAQWLNGRLVLEGFCKKPVLEKKIRGFTFTYSLITQTTPFTWTVHTASSGTYWEVETVIDNFQTVIMDSVDLYYRDQKIHSFSHGDLSLVESGFWANRYFTSAFIGAAGEFDPSDTPFVLKWPSGRRDDERLKEEFSDVDYEPAVMSSGFAHYTHEWLRRAEKLVLNGGARTAPLYHEWPSDASLQRTYQWGGDDDSGDREKFGMNGFTVIREPLTEPAPWIPTNDAGAQYLDLTNKSVGAGDVRVRLNTLCANALSRQASLSLQGALSWETQHTQEPPLPGQTAPVYLDFSGANGLYFWEIFFHAPHLIATRLQQEFDYASAQQWLELLFNPQMRVAPLFPPPADTDWLPYWSCRPLGLPDNPAVELEGLTNPDAIARGAPSHYRKAIFMLYVNNLIAWGDMLYRQVTRDTLNEAKLLYVRALSLLGPLTKGRSISRWEPVTLDDAAAEETQTFTSLEASMAERLTGLIPLQGGDASWLRLLDQSIFRLPVNTQLLDLWDSLDLRLSNLRHNLTLDGKPMHLALYEVPANPLDLLRAQQNGSSLSQRRLGSLAIVPPYRFRAMLPRAQNAVEILIRFSQQVLSHMESRSRAEQEELQQGHVLDDLATFAEQLQENAIDEASKGIEILQANRQGVVARKQYYDEQIRRDVSELEASAHRDRNAALGSNLMARTMGVGGHLANLAPNLFGGATGGMHWGGPAFAESEVMEGAAAVLSELAQQKLTGDMQTRRREEWQHQARQAELELEVLDRQIEAQQVALQSAQTSLAQATKSREQAQSLYAFIKGRATNAGLYQWLLSQMSTLYFQAYDAVLSLCLSTEACWQYEIGDRDTRFISASAWVDNRFGLTAGESLKLGLMQMESAFLSRHERRLEITKTLSLKALLKDYDPNAGLAPDAATGWDAVLDTLRTQGEIDFELKSSTFDADYPGHYLRQLVRVSVSLPVVLKPYQDIHATLSQQTSTYLLKPQIGNVKYLYQQAGELPEGGDDDVRQDQLVINPRANQQIGLSTGVDDHGMFQLDFGDERYFPFEGTGAISRWTLSFPHHEAEDQQAMLDTLTDVILHIRYLAVDGGKAFAADVEKLVAAVESGEVWGQATSLT